MHSAKARKGESTKQLPGVFLSRFRAFVLSRYFIVDTTLVLLDKDKITLHDHQAITYPLYDIELETGVIISPKIFSKQQWENQLVITPFYQNVMREGIVL